MKKLPKLPPEIAAAVKTCKVYIQGSKHLPSDTNKKLAELSARRLRLIDIEEHISGGLMHEISRVQILFLNEIGRLIKEKKGKQ